MLSVHAGAQTWTQLAPSGTFPYQQGGSVTVNDGNGDMIVFGGYFGGASNSTYVLQHANNMNGSPTWIQLSPSSSLPPARDNASGVYDPGTNRLVVFGGCEGGCLPVANDVWVLTNANGTGGAPQWTQLSPTGTPPAARQSAAAGYDPTTNRMIVFGGQNGGGSFGVYGDTWVLTNANGTGPADPVTGTTTPAWIQLSTGAAPTSAEYMASFYDPVNNRLVVTGGSNGSGPGSDAVWMLTNANGIGGTPVWTNLILEGAAGAPPDFTSLESTGYDPNTNNAFIIIRPSLELWELTNADGATGTAAWTEPNVTGLPSGTGYDSMGSAFDALTGIFTVLVQDSNNSSDQVWVTQAEAMGTKLSLRSSANPSDSDDSVTFTAVVTAATGTPTGSVTFYDGTTSLGNSTLSSGQATLTTNSLAGGSHTINAQYTPDTNVYAASTGSLAQTVISLSDLALLNGNNTFTGNQSVNGTVTANSFMGNGAGLTGVTAAGLNCTSCVTNSMLSLSYAEGDAQGGNAVNALALGGFPASAFAPVAGDANYAPAAGSSSYVSSSGGTVSGPLTSTQLNAPQLTSGAAGQNLSITALNGTGNGGAVSISAGNAGGTNGGGGGNLTLTAGNATPVGGAGYANQGPAGMVSIQGGGGYNGVGGNVLLKSGPNSNWSQTTNGFSSVQLQGGTLLGNDGAQLQVEGAHNGSSTNAALSYGGNISLAGGNGYGGLSGGNITLTPGTGTPNGAVNVAGNLTATGSVSANSLSGNGAGLTSLSPANISSGTAGISISGNAATATSATTAGSATTAANATELGGVTAANYARLDVGNTFNGSQNVTGAVSVTGNQTVSGNVTVSGAASAGSITIGGGSPITEYVSTTYTVAVLGTLGSGQCRTMVTGPLAGFTPGSSDSIALGIPNTLTSNLGTGVFLMFQAWETNTNISPTITIQICNPSQVSFSRGAEGTIRIDIFKHTASLSSPIMPVGRNPVDPVVKKP